MNKVYCYDNFNGLDIPEEIGEYKVELLLGQNISSIHNCIENNTELFFVFTRLEYSNIIVSSEKDVDIMKNILKFCKRDNYSVEYMPESIWYSNKVKHNIIFSSDIGLTKFDIQSILLMFLNEVKSKVEVKKVPEIYNVADSRTNKIIGSTPDFNFAKVICDQNPLYVIYNKFGVKIYTSEYNKTGIKTIPYILVSPKFKPGHREI